jgi:hypothetical protein
MCSWKRFRTFAREPEQRKADSNGCVGIDGIRYQLSHERAGQEVTLLWGCSITNYLSSSRTKNTGHFIPKKGPSLSASSVSIKRAALKLRRIGLGNWPKPSVCRVPHYPAAKAVIKPC